jgi:hypothetical protein
MAYKVLGQTATTASSARTDVNVISNGHFSGYASSSAVSVADNAAYPGTSAAAITSGRFFTNSHPSSSSVTLGYNSVNGVYIRSVPGTTYSNVSMRYGYTTSGTVTTSSAVPVRPSTSYTMGFNWTNYGGTGTFAVRVLWRDSTGASISTATIYNASASDGRIVTSAATSPATAAYAVFDFTWTSASGTIGFYINNISFSSDSTYATTYPNPTTDPTTWPGDVTTVAPFDQKIKGFESTTTAPNTSTVITYTGANVDLYTVPAASSAVVSTLTVSNLAQTAGAYRYAVVPSGQTLAKKHWIAFDIPIGANSTDTFTIGVTLATGDKIAVSSDTTNVSFTAFGNES